MERAPEHWYTMDTNTQRSQTCHLYAAVKVVCSIINDRGHTLQQGHNYGGFSAIFATLL